MESGHNCRGDDSQEKSIRHTVEASTAIRHDPPTTLRTPPAFSFTHFSRRHCIGLLTTHVGTETESPEQMLKQAKQGRALRAPKKKSMRTI
jgi:hypothetical protein